MKSIDPRLQRIFKDHEDKMEWVGGFLKNLNIPKEIGDPGLFRQEDVIAAEWIEENWGMTIEFDLLIQRIDVDAGFAFDSSRDVIELLVNDQDAKAAVEKFLRYVELDKETR